MCDTTTGSDFGPMMGQIRFTQMVSKPVVTKKYGWVVIIVMVWEKIVMYFGEWEYFYLIDGV